LYNHHDEEEEEEEEEEDAKVWIFFFPYFAIVAKKLRCASETCAELRR